MELELIEKDQQNNVNCNNLNEIRKAAKMCLLASATQSVVLRAEYPPSCTLQPRIKVPGPYFL